MKLNRYVLSSGMATVGFLALTGCGRGVTGTYTINQIQQASAMMAPAPTTPGGTQTNCQTTQATLNLVDNGGTVTGNAVNSCFTETLQGTHSGNGQITGITLTMIPMNTMGMQFSGSSNCVYVGGLSVMNDQISGVLTLQLPAAQQQGQNGGFNPGSMSMCSPSLTITGSMNP